MLSRTVEAWKSGAQCVAQGIYQTGEFTCIQDVLGVLVIK